MESINVDSVETDLRWGSDPQAIINNAISDVKKYFILVSLICVINLKKMNIYYSSYERRNIPTPIKIQANPKKGWLDINDKIVVTNDNMNIAMPPKIRYHAICFFSIC